MTGLVRLALVLLVSDVTAIRKCCSDHIDSNLTCPGLEGDLPDCHQQGFALQQAESSFHVADECVAEIEDDSSLAYVACRPKVCFESVACAVKCCPLDEVLDTQLGHCRRGHADLSKIEWFASADQDRDRALRLQPAKIGLVTSTLSAKECNGRGRRIALRMLADFKLLLDGRVVATGSNETLGMLPQEYCLELMLDADGHDSVGVIACDVVQEDSICHKTKFIMYPTAMIISCAALIVTLAVYALLPELRNVPGKTLMSLAASLLSAFVLLAFGQLVMAVNVLSRPVCVALALWLYYSFTAAFCWMTIMSFDIGWNFRNFRACSLHSGCSSVRYGRYCVFGWGVPLALCALALAIDLAPDTDHLLKPKFAVVSCWFYGSWEIVAYFYGPLGLLLAANALLFLRTSWSLWRLARQCSSAHKDSITLRKHSTQQPHQMHLIKQRLFIGLKLFLAMGVAWVFELVSWAWSGSWCWAWLLTDVINMLQGVWILVIFVGKRAIVRRVARRLGCGDNAVDNAGSLRTATEARRQPSNNSAQTTL